MKIGDRFGKLTIIKIHNKGNRGLSFVCECDCGNVKIIWQSSIKNSIKSCGCSSNNKGGSRHRKSYKKKPIEQKPPEPELNPQIARALKILGKKDYCQFINNRWVAGDAEYSELGFYLNKEKLSIGEAIKRAGLVRF